MIGELQVKFGSEVGNIETASLDMLKDWLDLNTAKYEETTVTEENLAQVDEDIASARKLYNAIEDDRKALKKAWDAPYEAWKAKYDEATSQLTGLIDDLAEKSNAIKKRQQDQRVAFRKNMILNDARDFRAGMDKLIDGNPALWGRIWKDSYGNKTFSENKFSLETRQALRSIQTDLEMVENHVENNALMPLFLQTGNVAEAITLLQKARKVTASIAPSAPTQAMKDLDTIDHVVSVKAHPTEEDMVPAQGRRAFRGPKYKVLALLAFADMLGLEVVKI